MSKLEIVYYNNGQKACEIYHNDKGEKHRKDGPAVKYYYSNSQKEIEEYRIDNNVHRENGPAVIYWNENEQIVYEEYWINNKKLDIFEIRKLKLEKLNLL